MDEESLHEKHAECMASDLVVSIMELLKDKPKEVVEAALGMVLHKVGYNPPQVPPSERNEDETIYTDAKGHILKTPLNELGLGYCRSCKTWCAPINITGSKPSGRDR